MKKPLRILMVNKAYPPHIGGIETLMRRYAICMQQQYQADVQVLVCWNHMKTKQETVEGIPVLRAATLGTIASCPISVTFLREFRRKAKEADVVVLNLPFPWSDLACLLSGYHGRVVLIWHSDVVRQKKLLTFYKPLLQWMLRRADRIFVATQEHIESSAFLPAFREKCRVVPYGIPISEYPVKKTHCILKKPGLHFHYARALFIGRLVYYKGVDVLVKAMRKVEDCDLFLVGSGPLRPVLSELADGMETVHFMDTLTAEDLRRALQDCDFLILPSVANSEAFGMVQLEAMVYSKPVINTALPTGVPKVSLDGVTGITVPPGDVDALAEAIQKLTSDVELRKQYGAAARERVETVFSEEVVMKQFYEFLVD